MWHQRPETLHLVTYTTFNWQNRCCACILRILQMCKSVEHLYCYAICTSCIYCIYTVYMYPIMQFCILQTSFHMCTSSSALSAGFFVLFLSFLLLDLSCLLLLYYHWLPRSPILFHSHVTGHSSWTENKKLWLFECQMSTGVLRLVRTSSCPWCSGINVQISVWLAKAESLQGACSQCMTGDNRWM